MKIVIAFVALFAAVLAAPPLQNPQTATILKSESDNIGVDGYKFSFETSDGTSRQESGELINAGTDHEAIVVRGSISYVDLDGTPYKLDFIADENGFQPVGAHLPH